MKHACTLFFVLGIFGFTSFAQNPTISSFSPQSGSVGTLITLTGEDLESATGFSIGGVSAIVISKTDSMLVGMVMPGTQSDAVSVSTPTGTVGSGNIFVVTATPFPYVQQGDKLVGSGGSGPAVQQGNSVAVSADGNTAIVGGNRDNNFVGAAWIYTRTDGEWTQQGPKLVGSGAIGTSVQGQSVGISADGNTAIVGARGDDNMQGAAWIYTRTDGIWTQQGPKLIGTGAEGNAEQGFSVSISADGNTAALAGRVDNVSEGAVWVFTRTGEIWSQQGEKLVGTGAVGPAYKGVSLAMSADGNTIVVGGPFDDSNKGAVWVFVREAGIWTQQGEKLVAEDGINEVQLGRSVALSADGNTAMAGGWIDNFEIGAAWAFTRTNGNWEQQGDKLVGSGAVGLARQGYSVALSADGNTAMVGSSFDNGFIGALWVYTRAEGVWEQQGEKVIGTGWVNEPAFATSAALSADGHTGLVGGTLDDSSIGAVWVFVPQEPLYSGAPKDGPNFTVFADGSELVIVPAGNTERDFSGVTITDMNGRTVLSQNASFGRGATFRIGLPELVFGVYIVTLQSEGFYYSQKVLLQ